MQERHEEGFHDRLAGLTDSTTTSLAVLAVTEGQRSIDANDYVCSSQPSKLLPCVCPSSAFSYPRVSSSTQHGGGKQMK